MFLVFFYSSVDFDFFNTSEETNLVSSGTLHFNSNTQSVSQLTQILGAE